MRQEYFDEGYLVKFISLSQWYRKADKLMLRWKFPTSMLYDCESMNCLLHVGQQTFHKSCTIRSEHSSKFSLPSPLLPFAYY